MKTKKTIALFLLLTLIVSAVGIAPPALAETDAAEESDTSTTPAPAAPDGVRIWLILQIGMIVLLAGAFLIFVIRKRDQDDEETDQEE